VSRESDLAWAAGLFEGEGCFSLHHKGRTARALLSMTDEDVVRRFHDIVGFGTVIQKTGLKPPNLPQWRWAANSRHEFERTVDLFTPWLGERRLRKAQAILATMRSTDWMAFVCTHCGKQEMIPIRSGCQAKRYCTRKCKESAHRERFREAKTVYMREWRRRAKQKRLLES
jgi:hypothetical protein